MQWVTTTNIFDTYRRHSIIIPPPFFSLRSKAKREPTVLFRAHWHAGATSVVPEQKEGVGLELSVTGNNRKKETLLTLGRSGHLRRNLCKDCKTIACVPMLRSLCLHALAILLVGWWWNIMVLLILIVGTLLRVIVL